MKIILILLSLLFISDEYAFASACKKSGGAKVIVKTKILATKYNYSKSIDQLTLLKSDTVSPYGRGVIIETHGLTKGKLRILANFKAERKNLAGNRSCISIDRVNMIVTYDPVIFIAKEHDRGSCLFNAVMKHEEMHVKLSMDKIKEYRSKIYKVMRKFDNNNHYSDAVSNRKIQIEQKKLEARYQKFITALTNNLNKQLMEVNSTIDTKSEYGRVQNSCK